jgi:hypothetical protein
MADALESVRDGRGSRFYSTPHAIAPPQQNTDTSSEKPVRPSRRPTFKRPISLETSASSDAAHGRASYKVSMWRRGVAFMAGKLGQPRVALTSSSDPTTTAEPDLEGQAALEKSWQAWGKQTTGPEAASKASPPGSLPDRSSQKSRAVSAMELNGSTTGPETVPLPPSCSSDADSSVRTEGLGARSPSVAPGKSRDKLEPESQESTGPRATSTSKTHPEESNEQVPKKTASIPAPRKTKRVRIAPPSGNLHEHLIYGYYNPGRIEYQPRRTLDQYGYAGIESTSHRDDDQVIYRYTKSDPLAVRKIFMVDQLWMWVLGNGKLTPYAFNGLRPFS